VTMRKITLENLEVAVNQLKNADDLSDMNIIYQGKEKRIEYPFWHHLNGPIADCLWHVGQIVSFRRTSGNPLTSGVSFFQGKVSK
ncbi:MAG: hypothetical protein RLO81_03800, partial [Fulvivirga sp.]